MNLSEYKEESPGIEEIRRHLAELTKDIVDNPLLNKIEKGTLTKEQWQEFAKQRYLAAVHFEQLLEVGIERAQALIHNLQDERGISENGNPLPTGPHEKWRQDFYTALGLDKDTLAELEENESTQHYSQKLQQLIAEGDVLKLAGAILFQEYSIPEEFKKLKVGRDLIFPQEFIIQASDTAEQRRQKGYARLYIDHHITHDANQHYPELERALEKYGEEPEKLKKILDGIKVLAEARKNFFKQ